MNHTPTPFYLAPIVDRRVAGDAGVKYQLVGANCTVATIYRSTDAAFIVRACNVHDELVARLEKLIEACERFAPQINCDGAHAALAKMQTPEQARAA